MRQNWATPTKVTTDRVTVLRVLDGSAIVEYAVSAADAAALAALTAPLREQTKDTFAAAVLGDIAFLFGAVGAVAAGDAESLPPGPATSTAAPTPAAPAANSRARAAELQVSRRPGARRKDIRAATTPRMNRR